MGKSISSSTSKLRNLAKSATHKNDNIPKPPKQTPQNHHPTSHQKPEIMLATDLRRSLPLAAVVSDCARRWFKDMVKEAQSGKISMQVLLAQMYYSGYGVPRNRDKGQAWIERASRTRPFICDMGKKCPGYVESDSDTDEAKGCS